LSRLGDPAPQPRSGAARFAAPDALTSKRQGVEEADAAHEQDASKRQDALTSKRQKQPMTIRLTPDAIDRLAEFERTLRRAGVKARNASASEIVEALIRSTTTDSVQTLMRTVR